MPLLKTLALGSLLLATFLVASERPDTLTELDSTRNDVRVLLQARATNVDLNGTVWVYHGLDGIAAEPQAAAVTAIRSNGTTRTYLASEILPPGSVMAGRVGQVFGVTPLSTRGLYAATAGWVDGDGTTHNAIVFFTEDAAGGVSNFAVINASGARAIAAGPHDTAVVAIPDPLHNGDTKLVTVVSANGDVLGTWGPFESNGIRAAHDRIAAVRFHQLDASSVALFDEKTQRVHALQFFAPAECAIAAIAPTEKPKRMVTARKPAFGVTELWSVPVQDTSDSGAQEVLPAVAFAATREGTVTVARGAVIDGTPCTLVTRYTTHGRQPTWHSHQFWRSAVITSGEVRGIIAGATPWQERMSLQD